MDAFSDAVVGGIRDTLAPILGTLIGTMAVAVLTRLLKTVNLDISAKQEAAVRATVQHVIRGLEEESRTAPMPSDQKLTEAALRVESRTGLTFSEASRKIHEELPLVRTATPSIPTAMSR